MEKPTFNNRKPNPLWWNKDKKTEEQQAADEIAAIKEQEEQLMREALYVISPAIQKKSNLNFQRPRS